MFTCKCLTFFYAITPVHMGAGQALGVIDNPIQRERHTEHPSFAASGIKGAFRHAARGLWAQEEGILDRIFGPEQDASDHAGAISFADAQLVAFPVRSLKGVYVYATSPLALQRLARLATVAGVPMPICACPLLQEDEVVVLNEGLLCRAQDERRLILESYAFKPVTDNSGALKELAQWLSENALPSGEGYAYFRNKLATDLVLLSDTQLTFFARNATVVEPHVRINDESGTADEGGLFFTENLPPEAIMVSLAMASDERLKNGSNPNDRLSAEQVMDKVRNTFDASCLQIGGDATTGRGQVLVRFKEGTS
ncbi:type III-B CRISPR module RAMP protein Cmr4 [Desulfosoma caldarium]|uniref:CRISPR-associated protein Cmr4 n=1 Tax=Desulfosoma caldarium TaxID=610254 RepID=A0A3N1UPR0_9BACT|nr:type III-B CRISPR module RAMP protein Cmr4 [Desulfosoma caldarium]ROQ92063.1 CRISPR-associated protein Cmr4 [Desulfosoma caldarium]